MMGPRTRVITADSVVVNIDLDDWRMLSLADQMTSWHWISYAIHRNCCIALEET
jgi:hypothetical protein